MASLVDKKVSNSYAEQAKLLSEEGTFAGF